MPPVGFEPTISAGERPQTYALDRATTGTGTANIVRDQIIIFRLAEMVLIYIEKRHCSYTGTTTNKS